MTTRTCAHPRCQVEIAGHELACRTHWLQLPILLRNRIWSNWKRNPGGKAHLAAIGAARVLWWKQVAAIELRCQHCRAQTVLIEDDTGQPICLTCLKPDLTRGAHPGSGILRCPSCRRDVIGLVSVGDGPQLCCDCQERRLAA